MSGILYYIRHRVRSTNFGVECRRYAVRHGLSYLEAFFSSLNIDIFRSELLNGAVVTQYKCLLSNGHCAMCHNWH